MVSPESMWNPRDATGGIRSTHPRDEAVRGAPLQEGFELKGLAGLATLLERAGILAARAAGNAGD